MNHGPKDLYGWGDSFQSYCNSIAIMPGMFLKQAERLAKLALTFWVASAFRQGCCALMCLRQGECVGGPLCHCQCPHHSGYVLSVCDRGKEEMYGKKCFALTK